MDADVDESVTRPGPLAVNSWHDAYDDRGSGAPAPAGYATISYGKERPLDPGTDEAARAKNRNAPHRGRANSRLATRVVWKKKNGALGAILRSTRTSPLTR